jgi:hypothetical protein
MLTLNSAPSPVTQIFLPYSKRYARRCCEPGKACTRNLLEGDFTVRRWGRYSLLALQVVLVVLAIPALLGRVSSSGGTILGRYSITFMLILAAYIA